MPPAEQVWHVALHVWPCGAGLASCEAGCALHWLGVPSGQGTNGLFPTFGLAVMGLRLLHGLLYLPTDQKKNGLHGFIVRFRSSLLFLLMLGMLSDRLGPAGLDALPACFASAAVYLNAISLQSSQ